MSLLRPVHHVFGPHADARHCRLALSLLLRPGRWRRGSALSRLRAAVHELLGGDAAFFSTGREAMRALLHALHVGPGDEVILQGYTCVVLVNAVRASGAVPVFVDIRKRDLSLDPEAVEKALTPRTKAIVCQHTFGIPAPLPELRALCDRRRIPLVEDCAHVILEAPAAGDMGRVGDFVLLSFGRDKAVSGVTGGAIVSRRTDVSNRLRKLEHAAADLPLLAIKRFLLYPLLYAVARPLYGIGVGKALLKLASVLGVLPAIVTSEERAGRQSSALHRLPDACAALAHDGLLRLREINGRRRALTALYLAACAERGWPVLHGISADLPLQKFPMFVEGAARVRRALKAKNIHLHDGWTGCVVCPETVDAAAVGYRDGDDPVAEWCGEAIVSLPTHPTTTEADARRLVRELRKLV